MSDDGVFAAARKVEDLADCHFYHVMEIPGYRETSCDWDLRREVEQYLRKVARSPVNEFWRLAPPVDFSPLRWKNAAPMWSQSR